MQRKDNVKLDEEISAEEASDNKQTKERTNIGLFRYAQYLSAANMNKKNDEEKLEPKKPTQA